MTKHKLYTKVLYTAFALALVAGLTVVPAAPAAALSQPTVSLSDYEISATAKYTIIFTLGEELIETDDTIIITFPVGTTVAADVGTPTIQASPGWFSGAANTTEGWQNSLNTSAEVDWDSDANDRTVTAMLTDETETEIGQAATVQIKITAGITNPSAVDDYTLTVKTSKETTAVESATYSIEAPVLGGTVYVYNPSDVLMETFSGKNALDSGNAGLHYGKADYTIEVGPGTYELGDTIDITGEGLTFKSTDGAESTIIDASEIIGPAIDIAFATTGVTIEGFTLRDFLDGGITIYQGADDVTVQNNRFIDGSWSSITLAAETDAHVVVTGATISGNVFEDCVGGITVLDGATDCMISDNTITGCTDTVTAITLAGGTEDYPTQGNTITGNTITDNAGSGIWLFENPQSAPYLGPYLDNNVIEDNTISENEGNGIVMATDAHVTNLVITGNDITDNEGVGILVGSWNATDAIKFNNITGNNADNDGYGLQNTSTKAVDATHNWWGTVDEDDIADMISDAGENTTYDPFLTDTVDVVFSATALDTGEPSLDAEDEVGVVVSTDFTNANYVISAAKYIANPGAPLDNPLAFYDVYVTGKKIATTDTVMLKFYAEDADAYDDDSVLWAWSAKTDTWVEVIPAAKFSKFGGYLHVTLNDGTGEDPSTPTIADLKELPFAVCTGEVPVVLESISALPSSVTLDDVGETQQLTVTATYDDASTAVVTATSTYVSVPETVATVSTGGLITAVAEGSAIITVSYTEDAVTKTDTVAVAVSVFDPWVYDVNDDDIIQKTEALAAVADYFALEISKAEALEVVVLYFP